MLTKTILATTTISFFLLIIFLNVTTPVNAGPFGILAIFIFSYVFLMGLFALMIHWISFFSAYLLKSIIPRRPLKVLSLKRSYYYSTIIAAAPIMLIAIQSVSSLGIYEFALVVIFMIIGCLYVSKKVN